MTRRHLFWFLLIGAISIQGCRGSQGASGLQDRLTWAANRVTLLRQATVTIDYADPEGLAFVMIAAPAGTRRSDLGVLPTDSGESDILNDCLSSGKAVLAVFGKNRSDCVSPMTIPEVRRLLVVRKNGGEHAELVVGHASDGALTLVEIK